MLLTFTNELGCVTMSGAGGGEIGILSISGLCAPEPERQLISSYDFDGVHECATRLPSRIIGIKGDIFGNATTRARLSRVLSEPCRLDIAGMDFERMINIRSAELAFSERLGAYTSFSLALTCDDPYFYDAADIEKGLFVREKLLSTSTVLPAVFSTRLSSVDINITGDRPAEPVITILGGAPTEADEGKIIIENLTSGKKFTLVYTPAEGELITVDVRSRTIISSVNGNIMTHISDDSFLADLVLAKGANTLKTTAVGATGYIYAYVSYKNRYVEAIV